VPVLTRDGYFVVCMRDVTERLQDEQALRESEARYARWSRTRQKPSSCSMSTTIVSWTSTTMPFGCSVCRASSC